MPSPLLPDRERRHLLQFHVWPRLGYRARMVAAAALVLAGLAAQTQLSFTAPPQILLGTLLILLAGTAFLLVKGYDLAPTGKLRAGEWEKTTRDRFQEVSKLEKSMWRWDQSFVDITCPLGFLTLAALALAGLVVFSFLVMQYGTRDWAPVFAADAVVLLLPHWIIGTRRTWRPVALRQQIEALETALARMDAFKIAPFEVHPMFQMAGEGSKRVPVSARVFVRFTKAPEDFLGMQLQVAINNVQGTKYPYLYAVLIAKQSFGLLDPKRLDFVRQRVGGLTVESKRESDTHVIVLRQKTTRQSGYHTKTAAIREITESAWLAAMELASKPEPAP